MLCNATDRLLTSGLVTIYYYTLLGNKVVLVPERYRYRTGHRLVPKWTGTEMIMGYKQVLWDTEMV